MSTTETSQVSDSSNDTCAQRRARYEFGIQRCAYIGAGYGGVFLLAGLAGDRVFRNTWWWVTPVLAGVITIGVGFMGWAYLKYGSALRDLRISTSKDPGAPQRAAYVMYVLSVIFLGIATVMVFWAMLAVLPPHAAVTPHPASSVG